MVGGRLSAYTSHGPIYSHLEYPHTDTHTHTPEYLSNPWLIECSESLMYFMPAGLIVGDYDVCVVDKFSFLLLVSTIKLLPASLKDEEVVN